MTPARKVELANEMIDLVYARVDQDGELEDYRRQECQEEIVSMIQAIERETWLAAAKQCESFADLARRADQLGKQDAYENMADWCEQQTEAAR